MVNGSSSSSSGSSAVGGGVINIRAGNFIRIDLQISGSPTPSVTWLKDHEPITASDRVRWSLVCVNIHQLTGLGSETEDTAKQRSCPFQVQAK